MRYDQLDIALSFLVKPDDRILLQVPYRRHIKLVQRYCAQKLGSPVVHNKERRMIFYPNRIIYFEYVVGNDKAGIGYNDIPTFLIEPAHTDDGEWKKHFE